MTGDRPTLFDWRPPPAPACSVIPFPLVRRRGKIRDVAQKLLTKTTDRHVESYQQQVSDALLNHLDRLGVAEHDQDEQLRAFWSAVEIEVTRLTYRGRRPGGDAA